MARPNMLKGEDVFALCDEWRAAGRVPTVRLIQGQLGGSTASLAAYLRQWREKSASAPTATEIPAELKNALSLHIQQEVAKATTDLKASLRGNEDDCRTLEEALASKETILIELESARRDLDQQLSKASAEITFLNGRIESLEAKSSQSQERELAAEKRAAYAEGRLEEIIRVQKTKELEGRKPATEHS